MNLSQLEQAITVRTPFQQRFTGVTLRGESMWVLSTAEHVHSGTDLGAAVLEGQAARTAAYMAREPGESSRRDPIAGMPSWVLTDGLGRVIAAVFATGDSEQPYEDRADIALLMQLTPRQRNAITLGLHRQIDRLAEFPALAW